MPKTQAGFAAPYTVARAGNKAEINLYGEVVSTRPIDFWTDEPVPGNYICQDEFLAELDNLRDADEITIHLNSVGGELYVGLAICNRLRELPGNVTVINDALAASAGSIILQGATPGCRVVKSASNTMVHQASSLLYGYYNQRDLEQLAKQAAAHNMALVNAYAASTGRDEDEIIDDLENETWMTGMEAVALGYADVVDEDESVPVVISADHRTLNVGGQKVAAMWLPKELPANLAVGDEPPMEPANTAAAVDAILDKGAKTMEITTLDGLRAAYPELVAQAEASAAAAERQRLQGIDEIAASVADEALLASARYGEDRMSAEQLALAAMRQQAVIGANMLQGLQNDSANSGAKDVGSAGAPEDKAHDPMAEAAADAKASMAEYNKMRGE